MTILLAAGCLAVFLAMVTVIAFVHELGHFLAARSLGMRVEVFAVGFGRELVGRTDRRGTRWSLRLLPLGGYIGLFGETLARDAAGRPRPLSAAEARTAYGRRPPLQRAWVVVAGPLANLLFALLALSLLTLAVGRSVLSPEIAAVQPGSPAALAGLVPGDRILAVEGAALVDLRALAAAAATRPALALAVSGPEGRRHLRLATRGAADLAALGLVSAGRETVAVGPVEAAMLGFERTARLVAGTLAAGAALVSGGAGGELAGPVRVAQLGGETMAAYGLAGLLFLTALLSVNIGLINLLPIPVLDGGHLLFLAIESLRGRPVSRRLYRISAIGGLAAILALSLLLTVNDLVGL